MSFQVKLMVLAMCIAAAGCSPLAPRPNYSRFVILAPLAAGANSAATTASTPARQLAIGIGPIDFPNYLLRSQVVTRSSPNQIELSTVNRWGEPLDKNFQRVLSENLAQLLNTYRIEQYPWDRKTQVDYQIAINVQNFETNTDCQSQLNARWIIKDGSNGKDLYASETTVNTPVGAGNNGAPAALSNDLATLSREIASRVTELSQRRNGYISGTGDPRGRSSAVAALQR
jgi:uncharacterized lipoprotein YmbA